MRLPVEEKFVQSQLRSVTPKCKIPEDAKVHSYTIQRANRHAAAFVRFPSLLRQDKFRQYGLPSLAKPVWGEFRHYTYETDSAKLADLFLNKCLNRPSWHVVLRKDSILFARLAGRPRLANSPHCSVLLLPTCGLP